MLRRRKRQGRSASPVPTDAETAALMQRLADTFVEKTRVDGYVFDWNPEHVDQLDKYCDEFIAGLPPREVKESVALGVGAYLGELMLRSSGGRWTYCTEQNHARLELANGLVGYPHGKVAKRLEHGSEHSLEAFYWYGVTREPPPNTIVTLVNPTD